MAYNAGNYVYLNGPLTANSNSDGSNNGNYCWLWGTSLADTGFSIEFESVKVTSWDCQLAKGQMYTSSGLKDNWSVSVNASGQPVFQYQIWNGSATSATYTFSWFTLQKGTWYKLRFYMYSADGYGYVDGTYRYTYTFACQVDGGTPQTIGGSTYAAGHWRNGLQQTIGSTSAQMRGYVKYTGYQGNISSTVYTTTIDINSFSPNATSVTGSISNGVGNITFSCSNTALQREVLTYTVAYNNNGGNGTITAQTKTHDDNLTLSNGSAFTKSDYTLSFWRLDSNSSTTTYSLGGTYTANANATMYAAWTAKTYTITYNANGGSGTVDSQSWAYDTTHALSTSQFTPPTGQTHVGWQSTSGGGTTYTFGQNYKMPSGGATIYARYTNNTFTVTYKGNGSTSGTETSTTATCNTNITLSASNTFSKTGYTFLGWNTTSTATVQTYTGGQTIAANTLSTTQGATVSLFAIWKINQYSVTYNANGGSGTVTGTTQNYDTTTTLPALNIFTKTGYNQTKWLQGSLTGTERNAGWTYRIPDSNTIFYAKWEPKTYTLTYDPNGGSSTGGTWTQTGLYDSNVNLATIAVATGTTHGFQNTGYSLVGWTIGTTTYDSGASYKIQGNATVLARWSVNAYTISFDANGGSGTVPTSTTRNYNTTYQLPAATLTKTGYTHDGWRLNAIDGGWFEPNYNYSVPAYDSLFYASWALNTYKLHFNANGGSGTMSDQTITYNQNTAINACTFTRSGYEFVGWSLSEDGEIITHAYNLTTTNNSVIQVYAIWKPLGLHIYDGTTSSWIYGIVKVRNATNTDWVQGLVKIWDGSQWRDSI